MRQRHSFNTTHDMFLKLLRSSTEKHLKQTITIEKGKQPSSNQWFSQFRNSRQNSKRKSSNSKRKINDLNKSSKSIKQLLKQQESKRMNCKSLSKLKKVENVNKKNYNYPTIKQINKEKPQLTQHHQKINISIQNIAMPFVIQKKKFTNQFNYIIHHMNHEKHIHLNETQCFLDWNSLLHILQQLDYFKKQNRQTQIALKLWKDLGGEEYGGFLKQNLFSFLQIIEGYYTHNIKNSTSNKQNGILKINEDLKIQINQSNIEYIYENYKQLKKNRKFNKQTLNSQQTQPAEQKYQPIKFKQNLIEQLENNFINKSKPVSKKSIPTNSSLSSSKQLPKKQNVQSILQIKNSQKAIIRMRKAELQRRQKLMKLSLNKQNIQTQQKSKKSIKFEKKKLQNTTSIPLREIKQQVLDQQIQLKSTNISRSLKKIPLLSVDVNLQEGKMEKIIVYEGDTAKEISINLAKKHHLDQQTRIRFENILHNHISGFLSRIDELQEEEFLNQTTQ